jgi:hypothetical protein
MRWNPLGRTWSRGLRTNSSAAIVPPLEFHLAVFDTDDPMIGNGDPVGVTAGVVNHLLWSGEWWLDVDDPLHVSHRIEMTAESLRILQCRK